MHHTAESTLTHRQCVESGVFDRLKEIFNEIKIHMSDSGLLLCRKHVGDKIELYLNMTIPLYHCTQFWVAHNPSNIVMPSNFLIFIWATFILDRHTVNGNIYVLVNE